MARIRTIKPEFWTDSKTGTLSGIATKLFLGILNHCDDYGVIKMDMMELKAKVLPYEFGDPTSIITPLLFDELLPKGLLTMFQYSEKDQGTLQEYLYVTNFQKHQRIDKPGTPAIDKWLKTDSLDTFLGRLCEQSDNVLITFSPERKGKEQEGNGRECSDNQKTLSLREYAHAICQQAKLPATNPNVDVVTASLDTIKANRKLDDEQAASWLRDRVEEKLAKGEPIDRFWFENARYEPKPEPPEKPKRMTVVERMRKQTEEFMAESAARAAAAGKVQ